MTTYDWKTVFEKIHQEHRRKHSNPDEDYQTIRDLIHSRENKDVTLSLIDEDELTEYIDSYGSTTLKNLFPSLETIKERVQYLLKHVQFLNETIEDCQRILSK